MKDRLDSLLRSLSDTLDLQKEQFRLQAEIVEMPGVLKVTGK